MSLEMKSILLVEDNDDIREMVVELLRPCGYEVCEAENGLVALEKLSEMAEPPCLLLLDLSMPVMGGAELLQILESRGQLASMPVLVVSAVGDLSLVPAANKFCRKPLDPMVLLQLVADMCGEAN
jgi:CheY-like chemotaxis protein